MSPVTKFGTCFIIFILLLSSLSIFVFAPETAKAQDSAEGTVLYFHDYFGVDEETSMINQSPPSKDNDSMWPPSISNTEEWLFWFMAWLDYKAIEGYDDFGNPFTLTEDYIYEGQEPLEIEGAVTFDLYFSSTLLSKILKDSVDVSIIYIDSESDLYDPYEEIGNKTVEIKSDLSGGKIQQQEIKIEDVTCNLKPGDILEFSIKLIQTNKPIGTVIKMQDEEELMSIAEQIADTLIAQNIIPKLKDVGEAIKEVLNSSGSEGFNITMDDIAELANAAVSSSFVYDSIEHRSSVTLPVAIFGEEENTRTYYLHDENKMNETLPTKDKASQLDLKKGSPKWDGPVLERSKTLKEATASLYIDHLDLIRLLNIIKGKIKVTATLIYGDTQIASSEEELSRTTLLGLLQKPKEPMMFTFGNITDKEIKYGTGLSLEVSAKGTKFGFLGLRRNAKLLYDSTNYPSSLTVKFGESNHIKILGDSSDKKVALGGSVNYTLTVSSDFAEDISITTNGFSQDEKNKWDIEINPEKISISEKGQETFTIVVKSTASKYNPDAYENEDSLGVIFVASGKTGKTTFAANVKISEDAVEHNIEIVADPNGQKIKYGENGTYIFTIKNINTGFWPDSYTIDASSEHDWALNLSKEKIDLAAGKKAEVKVKVSVPKDTKGASSDVLAFTVTSTKESKKSVTLNITTTVVGPNILESLYDAFDSAAKSLGLDGVFGSYAPHFLATIIFIILFFIIIMLAYFLTRKYVNVICLERVKEITPEGEAKFEITIQNPYKHKFSYEIKAEEISSSQGWNISLDTAESIVLEPKQSKTVILTVKPTSFVKSDDWAEVRIVAKALEKQKTAEISTVTTIKDAKPELYVTSVFHWPKVFNKGELLETSFKLENKGNVSASNVTVVLYVNGKEKNKVENVTIPAGGYADIKMPWIAVKGKNEVNIVVE
ncbi:MAG: hypothetical protein NTV74_01410 [Euryarchaeota archaeon]|nr:hypothetical protein [Euryarchaeota archaeon]